MPNGHGEFQTVSTSFFFSISFPALNQSSKHFNRFRFHLSLIFLSPPQANSHIIAIEIYLNYTFLFHAGFISRMTGVVAWWLTSVATKENSWGNVQGDRRGRLREGAGWPAWSIEVDRRGTTKGIMKEQCRVTGVVAGLTGVATVTQSVFKLKVLSLNIRIEIVVAQKFQSSQLCKRNNQWLSDLLMIARLYDVERGHDRQQ